MSRRSSLVLSAILAVMALLPAAWLSSGSARAAPAPASAARAPATPCVAPPSLPAGPQPNWRLPYPSSPTTSAQYGSLGLHDDNFSGFPSTPYTLTGSGTNCDDASLDILSFGSQYPNDPNAGSIPVTAMAPGKVLVVGNTPQNPCHVVLVDHGGANGDLSAPGLHWWVLYVHLAHIQVNVGDMVTEQTALGYPTLNTACGETTNAIHVHFAFLVGSGTSGQYVSMAGQVICGHQVLSNAQALSDPNQHSGNTPFNLQGFTTLSFNISQSTCSSSSSQPGHAILTLPTGNNPDGCTTTVLPANDDGSTGLVPLPFTANFFGTSYTALYVNNNGNVTFDGPLIDFTPTPIINTNHVIIAPFWADVDTRGIGSQPVTYSFGGTVYNGHPAFCVDWVNVGYFNLNFDKLNSFQLVLIDRSDVAPGDFDIMMNYNQVQWETGDASGGIGGLGGASARVGYSNGVNVSFELPGSGVNGAFLDSSPSGLIYNNRLSPLQNGRYLYPVRNGTAPQGGSISGTVYANSSTPDNALAGAFVQVCSSGGFCQTTTTDTLGQYVVAGLADGSYTVTAYPPGYTSLFQGSIGPLPIVNSAALTGQDIILVGPTPPPSGTTITSVGTGYGGLPVVFWGSPLTLTTTACAGGTASYQIFLNGSVVRSGGMAEGPAGTYTATIAPLQPIHGNAHLVITVVCPSGPPTTIPFDIYIDPSGVVKTVAGDPIAGATVTLFRSDSSNGPFDQVPAGSGIMSLANRQNPDVTDSNGHFGWDVVAGFYFVRASKPGCTSPNDPNQPYVDSAILSIPPAVTNLDLRLSCPAGQFQANPSVVNLTTTPGSSPSPQTVNVQNVGPSTINWSANSLPSFVSVSPTSGTLVSGGSVNLTLTFNTPATQVYTTNLVLTDTNPATTPLSVPITVVSANVSKTWYFAEGFTGGSFSEFLTLANPNSVGANVQVQYLLGNAPPITKNYLVGQNARFTIKVNNEIGSNQNVSMVVTSDQPIIAERPMYFTFTGLSGFTIPGGTDVLGATQLATNFDFGYLDVTAGHATFLTILNQNNSQMTVTINYFAAAGGNPIQRVHTVAANSRGTVNVNAEGLSSGTYSALVTLSQAGLVERPLYLKDASGFTGSADVVGVATPQQNWYFAEGFTASTFDERYFLSNPSTSVTAHATVTFFRSDGTTATAQVTLAPGQQQIVDANTVLGSNNINNSAKVQADQPILAERFISFLYTGAVGGSNSSSIPGASDVLGANAPSNLFFFAEGYTGNQFAEYLTIENPDPTNTAYVTVTFLPANGAPPTVRIFAIAPSSRFTLFTNSVLNNQSFSMVVESNIAIVAERPMYFNFTGGQTGGSDVIGYQP